MGYPRTRTRSTPSRVQWKDATEQPSAKLSRYPHIKDVTTDEELEIRVPYLYKGALWRTRDTLWEDGRFSPDYYTQHEHMYLVHEMWQAASRSGKTRAVRSFPAGSVAIYAGEVRVEEQPWTGNYSAKGRAGRYARHIFIVGGSIYMAANLRNFEPVF